MTNVLYSRLPKPAKSFVKNHVLPWLNLPFVRNKTHMENLRFLQESEKWSADQLRDWQYQKVKAVIEHAEKYVPFYQKKFSEVDFASDDLKSLEDLKYIPTTSKEEIKANIEDCVSKNVSRKDLIDCFTGGSTSEPMHFYLDKFKNAQELSFFDYIWRKYDYVLGRDKTVFFKANKAPNPDKNVFCSIDSYYKYLRCDSNYINNPDCFKSYEKMISNFGAEVLFGYPSSLYQLATMYKNKSNVTPKFRLILMASENVYPWQIKLLKEVFQPENIFYHYGHSEQVLLGYKCPEDERIQMVPQYGYPELLGQNGKIVTEPGKTGELVGTGWAFGMPFIRYKTKDYGKLSNNQKGLFNTGLILDKIEGRLQEFVVTKDRRLISICTIGGFHFPELEKVLHMQYFQHEEGKLELHYVENYSTPLTKDDIKNVESAFYEALNGSIELLIKEVTKISLTNQNKKSMIIQKLDPQKYLEGKQL